MALYVYGYAPAEAPSPPPPDQEVAFLALSQTPLLALAREVDPTEWTGPEAEANSQRLEWIGPRAIHHETIVRWAHEHLPSFYPTSLATVFSSLDSLEDALVDYEEALSGYFADTWACSQWTLKGLVDKAELERAAAPAPPTSGADYLRRRAKRTQTGPPLAPLEEMARELMRSLRPLARDICLGEPRAEALRWHLLVEDAAADEFLHALEDHIASFTPRGLTLQIAGPIAPYHFRP